MQVLLQIAKDCGTPTYAYDLQVLRRQITRLLSAYPSNRLRYSLKANPSHGLCKIIAAAGLGADVSSQGELVIALKAGFPASQICVSGPYKSEDLLDHLSQIREAIVSIDSLSELDRLARTNFPYRIVLRLKCSAYDKTQAINADDRFGIRVQDLWQCREYLPRFQLMGFHVYSRSQILEADLVIQNLRRAVELAQCSEEILSCKAQLLNFGAGLGVPYKVEDSEVPLEALAAEMKRVSDLLSPTRVVLELGRYIVAQAGWYLTSVVATQRLGNLDAVVVDGGTHQRSDLCGIGLRTGVQPPVVFRQEAPNRWTAVLGCLCLPSDILADRVLLPPLEFGDLIAFPNAGAYGAMASPLGFLCHPEPAEAAFDGEEIVLLRERTPIRYITSEHHGVR